MLKIDQQPQPDRCDLAAKAWRRCEARTQKGVRVGEGVREIERREKKGEGMKGGKWREKREKMS